jgi:hypothetical protein
MGHPTGCICTPTRFLRRGFGGVAEYGTVFSAISAMLEIISATSWSSRRVGICN